MKTEAGNRLDGENRQTDAGTGIAVGVGADCKCAV